MRWGLAGMSTYGNTAPGWPSSHGQQHEATNDGNEGARDCVFQRTHVFSVCRLGKGLHLRFLCSERKLKSLFARGGSGGD